MNELRIPATKSSPEVVMTPDGAIKIKGRSIHENIIEFYKPVAAWVNEYIKVPADITCIDISLEYFNSASAKILVQLCQRISHVQLKYKKFIINWYYEEGDDDLMERGEYYESILEFKFNFFET